MNQDSRLDRINRMIILSLVMNIVMVALSFGFAALTRSNAILLDGFFSLIGLIQVIAMRAVVRMQSRPDDPRHPFGFGSFVPLLNTIRGLTILVVSAFAGVQAVLSIVDGGESPDADLGILYGVIAAAGCLGTGWVIARVARESRNPLLRVDAHSWMIDGFYSLVVALAFVVALVLQSMELNTVARYVDPVLVLVLLLLAIPWPWGYVRSGLKQLLLLGPSQAIRDQAIEIVNEAMRPLEPDRVTCRVLSADGQIYIMCHVLLPPDRVLAVSALDEARSAAISLLARKFEVQEFDLVVTGNEDYGRMVD
ncbi:MAG: cation diffusion facilitator family transporter [Phycisphaerales bacterium]|nr:cation diffusion facilitator family transporter [Phycisphaerales bacterium]